MTAGGHSGHAASLRDYLHVVRRRKWIILPAVLLVPAAAVAFSLHQQKLYQASAQVLLSTQNLAATLTGTQQTGITQDPIRIAQTQADVARVPTIAQRVLTAFPGAALTVDEFLGASSVSTATNADILTFDVTNHDPLVARELVDAYAREYTIYRRQLDTAAISSALKKIDLRIKQLVKSGGGHSALYGSLVDRQETLTTLEALQTSNASVVETASSAAQIQPRPKRNGILGLALGIVLGIGLAFLWEALDTRVRNAQEIGERLGGLPLLARVPAPSKKLRAEHKLVMLAQPNGVQAETFRMLRTNLDFVTLDRHAHTLMVTSAVEQEGKSTTVANLGIALARAGQRVVLVDLDLRRPYGYVAYRVGNGPDAEDITSETFERALRYRDSYDPRRGEPASWLIGIARRCIADAALRGGTPTAEVPERAGEGHEETALRRLELRDAVAQLDERDRELVALRFGADLSARQIAGVLDLKTNAVEVALHRALGRLRRAIEQEDSSSGESLVLKPEASK